MFELNLIIIVLPKQVNVKYPQDNKMLLNLARTDFTFNKNNVTYRDIKS